MRDAVLADEQAACLREAYEGIENFRDALAFLFSGFFRGYAHVEKHFGAEGTIERENFVVFESAALNRILTEAISST